jgi:hypothetical protein
MMFRICTSFAAGKIDREKYAFWSTRGPLVDNAGTADSSGSG